MKKIMFGTLMMLGLMSQISASRFDDYESFGFNRLGSGRYGYSAPKMNYVTNTLDQGDNFTQLASAYVSPAAVKEKYMYMNITSYDIGRISTSTLTLSPTLYIPAVLNNGVATTANVGTAFSAQVNTLLSGASAPVVVGYTSTTTTWSPAIALFHNNNYAGYVQRGWDNQWYLVCMKYLYNLGIKTNQAATGLIGLEGEKWFSSSTLSVSYS